MNTYQLGIEEVDTNSERAAAHKQIRDGVRALPHEKKMNFAREQYRYTLANFDKLATAVAEGEVKGLTIAEIIDRQGTLSTD